MTEATLREALLRAKQGAWAMSVDGTKSIRRAEYVVQFFEDLGKPNLSDIGSAELAKLRSHFTERGRAASTINGHLSSLSVIYLAAREAPELTKYRPDIAFLTNRKKRNRILSDAEEAAMSRFFANDVDMHDICFLALDTGLRETELLKLTQRDGLDLDDAEAAALIVRAGKSDASEAAVSLTDRAVRIFKRRAAAVAPGGGLFEGLRQWTVIRRWNAFRKHMGLSADKGFTFHCLRHSTATRLIDEGVDPLRVKDFMRHEHITTTLKYVKNSARRQRGARDALEKRTSKRELADA